MSDSIKRIDTLRSLYNAKNTQTTSSISEELRELKTELKIANEERALAQESNEVRTLVGSATSSPYLSDQPFYNKERIYNSPKEDSWKEVRSEEQNRQAAYNLMKLKKLNII